MKIKQREEIQELLKQYFITLPKALKTDTEFEQFVVGVIMNTLTKEELIELFSDVIREYITKAKRDGCDLEDTHDGHDN